MTRVEPAKDLLELLEWIEEAQARHPEARIDHVERVVWAKPIPDRAAPALIPREINVIVLCGRRKGS